MSKRGAKNQINKDGRGGDSDEEGEGGESEGVFTSAPPAVIAERKIRGLPSSRKPTSSISSPLPSPPISSTPPVFGGFTGFAPTPIPTSSNPFSTFSLPSTSFTMPAAVTPVPVSAFGAPKTTPSLPIVPIPSAPFSFGTVPAPASPPPALTYYMSLRALNLALVDALSTELQVDQFMNLGLKMDQLKERYNEHRNKLEKEFEKAGGEKVTALGSNGNASLASKSAVEVAVSTPTPMFGPKPILPPSKPILSLPTPPTSLTWGGNAIKATTPSISTSLATPPPGSFIPNLPTPKVIVKEKEVISKPTPVVVPAKLTNLPSVPSSLRFGETVTSSPPTTIVGDSSSKPPAFSFGASFGKIAKESVVPVSAAPNMFAFGAASTSTSTTSNSAPAPFTFGSSTTTTTTVPVSNPFAPTSTPIKPFSFATTTTPITPPVNPFGIIKTSGSSPTFSFGAALNKSNVSPSGLPGSTTTTGFGFGSSGNNPPMFGGFPASSSSTVTGFGFGSTPLAPVVSKVEPEVVVEETVSEAGTSLLNTATTIAEGEEGETVVANARAKVYKFVEGSYKDIGVAQVFIKERKEADGTSIKRVLARNEGNNAVTMNFRIQSPLVVKIEKTFLTFMGAEGSEVMSYRLRCKTVEEAVKFKEDLEKA